MQEIKAKLQDLQDRIKRAEFYFNESKIKEKITSLEKETMEPDFWQDPKHAAQISQKLEHLKQTVKTWEDLESKCADLIEFCDIIEEEHAPEERENVIKETKELEEKLEKEEIKLFLNGKYDANNAVLSIHAGTGGTDAKDFAEMLMRMYLRYAEKQGFKTEILEKADEADAGIKSATISVKGPYVYGYLKEERGVHRLVRLSPFNAGNTRETSFALVEVVPELEEENDFEIKKEDLRVDVYRASGAGGQHVNKTESAVRITHIPTGLVSACQSERSQIQNKERAMALLKGKIAHLMEEERAETLEQLKGGKKEVSWGSQIRSYTLHPYKLVKDHRTGFESSNPEKVLDGETLEEFIEYSLEKNIKEK
ncbi:MAG: Peptide chain release factor 2 [Candidatus Peregrinibacteria bacterium GW2011_GWA2_33_10]